MKKMLEPCKGNTIFENTVKIISSLKEENVNQIKELAKQLME